MSGAVIANNGQQPSAAQQEFEARRREAETLAAHGWHRAGEDAWVTPDGRDVCQGEALEYARRARGEGP